MSSFMELKIVRTRDRIAIRFFAIRGQMDDGVDFPELIPIFAGTIAPFGQNAPRAHLPSNLFWDSFRS